MAETRTNAREDALQLLAELRRAAWNSPELTALRASTESAFEAAADYAVGLGELVGQRLSKFLRPADDGPVDPASVSPIVTAALRWLFEMLSRYTAERIREDLRAEGLGLQPVLPHFAADRAESLAEKLGTYERWADAAWLLDEPVINFAQNVIDDFVRSNAAAWAAAGLHPIVRRISDSETCPYCTALAGLYGWPAPPEVFRRHERCRCKVTAVIGKNRIPNLNVRLLYDAAEKKSRKERIARATAAKWII